MPKEEEIEELLFQGISPREIIDKGYAKSTVYKVNKGLGGGRKKRVSLEYVISSLVQEAGGVKMTLREPSRLPPPEEIERLRREALKQPQTEIVDESEQLQKIERQPETFEEKMIVAIKKQAPEVFSSLTGPKPPSPIMHIAYGPTPIYREIELLLSYEQYRELGRPPLMANITLSLKA